MKIVINKCYGGFGVSGDFLKHYNIPYEKTSTDFYHAVEEIKRTDKRLIEYIEKFGGEKASSAYAKLCIEEIEKGTLYRIDEYDGFETLETKTCDDEWEIAE